VFAGKTKLARMAATALAAAAAFTVLLPGTALAINQVACGGRNDLLKIWSHLNGQVSVDCYANAGLTSFGGWWVDQISTGNNDLRYYDANGDVVRINRWTVISYPNRPPKVDVIEIL
jgi:hypothetical protein